MQWRKFDLPSGKVVLSTQGTKSKDVKTFLGTCRKHGFKLNNKFFYSPDNYARDYLDALQSELKQSKLE